MKGLTPPTEKEQTQTDIKSKESKSDDIKKETRVQGKRKEKFCLLGHKNKNITNGI